MKHALITGGASGLGESLVKKFVSEGFKVTYTYNNSKPKLKIENGALNSIKIDLSKSDEIIKLNDVFKNQKIDVFINNAALSIKTPFTQIKEDELRSIFEVNVISSFKLMQKAFINMQKNNGGKIINIGSIGGQIGGVDQIHYASSKGAQESLIKSLARIGFKNKIYTFNISPGCIDTQMLRTLNSELDLLEDSIPFGKISKTSEISEAIFMLCNDSWNYASGQTINYNGGLLL